MIIISIALNTETQKLKGKVIYTPHNEIMQRGLRRQNVKEV
jgi:hypothetical protein